MKRLEFLAKCLGWPAIIIAMTAILSCGSGGGSGGQPAVSGAVSGVVTDITTGSPLAGVVVSDGKTTVTTGADGAYKLTSAAGSCIFTATLAGYESTSRLCRVVGGTTVATNWRLTPAHGDYIDYGANPSSPQIPAAAMDYVILAWNDLGMHCAQDDYSYFLILPPYNTLHVQVFQRGAGVVTSGITVSFAFPNKTNSAANTNFWTYAASYGWSNLQPNIGITGTPLAGTMKPDASGIGFVATGIPLTPYDDNGTWNPYGTAVITVRDSSTNAVLQTASVVVPISTELNCSNCHGTANPQLNILQAHDRRSGTTLAADQASGKPHLCGECHADNALGLPGKPGVENLSLAMHNFHKDKMNVSADPGTPDCYNCHPGPRTRCLRGVMSRAGMSCRDCHGDMSGMAAALKAGRRPWLDEPKCGDCHGPKHRENANTLFRDSVLNNSPEAGMNGKIYCEACHNSTHAEFTSSNSADNNTMPQQLQGDNYWIWNCYVCHTDYMPPAIVHR